MKRILLLLLLSLIAISPVSAQTPFYQGKTVQIRVGFAAGGAFDVWARVIANYLGKYVPGNPMFVVQNMTGGGLMIAANYVYGVAKPDGLTLGVVSPAMYVEQVTGKKKVQYDWFKFSYIGPPAMPADRLKMLRDGFNKMITDPELLADAKKKGLDATPASGEELEAMIKDAGVPSQEIIRQLKPLLEN